LASKTLCYFGYFWGMEADLIIIDDCGIKHEFKGNCLVSFPSLCNPLNIKLTDVSQMGDWLNRYLETESIESVSELSISHQLANVVKQH
jgi:hypothetical protein